MVGVSDRRGRDEPCRSYYQQDPNPHRLIPDFANGFAANAESCRSVYSEQLQQEDLASAGGAPDTED
jgi:hypothetical protein